MDPSTHNKLAYVLRTPYLSKSQVVSFSVKIVYFPSHSAACLSADIGILPRPLGHLPIPTNYA